MAARPPTRNEDPEEPTAFGIVAVDDHLTDADLEFPATKRDVVDALGDPRVPRGPNDPEIALSTVLERVDRERFESRRQLLDDLHHAFEAERTGTTSVLAWLKSLFSA
ncbi:DUF5789 family protein [Halobacterium bonnevillei]|uniref:DUF2795 domain-containing protein n=1 Tax=Halobacterium bonnevillei TaxID=2692200 RepID=A0A6B0SDI6_9EURY|nr:hypothetical protein [Halobacterium bonnevillei]MXR19805.1 hypothetical protein [Halobacterium bonnevillei]